MSDSSSKLPSKTSQIKLNSFLTIPLAAAAAAAAELNHEEKE
jgi:hypothetical protein